MTTTPTQSQEDEAEARAEARAEDRAKDEYARRDLANRNEPLR